MKIGFYTQGIQTEGMDFGCLTQGFSGEASGKRIFARDLAAESFFGSYDDALAFAGELKDRAKAAIVFTDGAGNENRFVRELSSLISGPVVGGGAARTFGGTGDGFLVPRGETAVCVLTGEGLKCRAEKVNLHTNIVEECELELSGKRIVKKINGTDAALYLRTKKEQLGFQPGDFERVTLSTFEHVNAHLSEADGVIHSGRDLEEHMLLRSVVPGEYQSVFERFYQETDDAIVFGCAGLKSILEHPFPSSCAGAFLFGEICALENGSDFGNLMLSRLVIS